jgi:hypothetical protein
MSLRLNRAQAYHDAIRKAFLTEWDPIGVRDAEEAQDEYDSYVSTIYKYLITRKTIGEIFDYLWWLETQHMGLVGDRQATRHFAERLLQIAGELEKQLTPT